MYLDTEVKQGFFKEHGKSETDSGTTEAQVALFTHKIAHLTEHLKSNRKDFGTQRSLLNMVGRRRRMLDYLKANDIERYRAIVKKLKLRK